VSGCGPIGVLTIVAARLAGAERILATDIARASLDMASRMGADEAFDVSGGAAALQPYAAGKGRIDAAFECSGAPQAVSMIIPLLRPRGRLVLVGLGGDAPLSINTVVAKELQVSGSFRFDREFEEAAQLIGSRKVDLAPLVSAVYPMLQAKAAFEHAGDRSRATKVSIALSDEGLGV